MLTCEGVIIFWKKRVDDPYEQIAFYQIFVNVKKKNTTISISNSFDQSSFNLCIRQSTC